jgi:hypothetical protein
MGIGAWTYIIQFIFVIRQETHANIRKSKSFIHSSLLWWNELTLTLTVHKNQELVILLYVTIMTEKTEDERVSSIKQLTNRTQRYNNTKYIIGRKDSWKNTRLVLSNFWIIQYNPPFHSARGISRLYYHNVSFLRLILHGSMHFADWKA